MKKIFNNLKDYFTLKKCIAVIIVIAVITSLFSIFFYLLRPFSEDEWKLCETIAKTTYDSSGNAMIELPKHFSVDVSASKIAVSHEIKPSILEATLKDGELIFTRYPGTLERIFASIVIATFTPLTLTLIICIIILFFDDIVIPAFYEFKEKLKIRKRERNVKKIKRRTKRNRLK